jgi:hypothetical protein
MAKLNAADRKKLPASSFALPSKRMFPLHDDTHIKMAWDMVARAKGLSSDERDTARTNILAAAKKAGIDTKDWDKKAMSDDMIVGKAQALTDATEEGPLRRRFKGSTANAINENNRLYPQDVMKDGVERAREKAVTQNLVGESPHPKALKNKNGEVVFDTNLANSVLKIYDVFMQGNDVLLDAEVLETKLGLDLKAAILQDAPVGISMRSSGTSIQRNIDGKVVDVATYLDISSFDVVMNPATEGCGVLQPIADSQLSAILDSDLQEEMADAVVAMSQPMCLEDGEPLNPVDPDGDGDIDFLECPKCGSLYTLDTSLTSHSDLVAAQNLCKMNMDDYDTYSQARTYLATKQQAGAATDSVKKQGGNQMSVNMADVLKAMKEDPEVRQMMAGIATETAKPALDAVTAQGVEKIAAQAKIDAKIFFDAQVATLKGKVDENKIKIMTDAYERTQPVDTVQATLVYDTTLKLISDDTITQVLAGLAFNPANNPGDKGQTRVEFGEPAKPYMVIVDKVLAAFDDYGRQFGKVIDPSLRKCNREMVDKIISRHVETIGARALVDSVVDGDLKVMKDNMQGFEMLTDAVSITTAQLLSQPTILTAVLIQSFQDVESLQFLFADIFEGTEWRIPVETFAGAETANPATGLLDFVVAEGIGIPESAIDLTWQTYQPDWRRVAASLSTDVVEALRTGPARYDAISRAIYHIGEAKRRRLDNTAYLEMLMASDEYLPTVIFSAPETPTAGNVTAVSVGTNVAYKTSLTIGGTASAHAGTNPVVRPRQKKQLQVTGAVQTVVVNPFVVKVGGSALVMGYLDGAGNVQSFAGTTATYAVDFENGIVYFTSGAGLNPSAGTPILPTFTYSAVTNYDRWIYTIPTGSKPEDWYNTHLQQLSVTAAMMGSSPRYKKPNLAIYSLNSAVFVENAQMFYKLAQPEGTRLITTGNFFGQRSGMDLAKINAPWAAGDGRILLTQKGSTRYGVQTPFRVQGPYPKYDSNQQILSAKLWYGEENSVLATPQVTDANGNILNPVSRTIKIVAS